MEVEVEVDVGVVKASEVANVDFGMTLKILC